jgi:uncharacterized protein YcbK (DUF882 family)
MNGAGAKRRDLLIASGLLLALPVSAIARPSLQRRLSLKNANTGESFDGTYRDETGPIASALSDLATLLRDHHTNQVAPIDIGTLDFLADVMAAVGQSRATVLSGYRAEATNAKLVAKFGAAEHSQHLAGRAIDVTFDRKLADTETAARRMQRGGVGWYPRSHFIHLDSGPARSWQKEDVGLEALLSGKGRRRPLTVAERQQLHRAIARREFLSRR